MIFKGVPLRLGKGDNIHGRSDGDSFRLYYHAAGEDVVRCKILRRRASYVDAASVDKKFEGVEVVPLASKVFVSGGEKRVKVEADD